MAQGLDKELLLDIVRNYCDQKVLVVGDCILDVYVYGHAIGKSAETPTLVAREESTSISFGGAGSVVMHLLELGAEVIFVSSVGKDDAGKHYDKLAHPRLRFSRFEDPDRCTTVKKRFWVDGYKLLQLDCFNNQAVSSSLQESILDFVRTEIGGVSAALLVDYRHGMMTTPLIREVLALGRAKGVTTFASSQVSQRSANHIDYSGSDYIVANLNEVRQIFPNLDAKSNLDLISERLEANVCVTLGAEGAVLRTKNRGIVVCPAIKVAEVDTCGAGDAFLATLSISPLAEHPMESLFLGNCWAGLAVAKKGTAPPPRLDLINYLSDN